MVGSEYANIATTVERTPQQACVDKLVAVAAMAQNFAEESREFQELVLSKVGGASSRSDDQAAAWANFVKGLPYRREPVEILRNPLETAKYGGDCDDLVTLLLAGWMALSLTCEPEIIADAEGNGFHIRARIGFPVLAPELWVVVDPVSQSEAAWATAIPQDLPIESNLSPSTAAPSSWMANSTSLREAPLVFGAAEDGPQWMEWGLKVLALYGGIVLLQRMLQDDD